MLSLLEEHEEATIQTLKHLMICLSPRNEEPHQKSDDFSLTPAGPS